MVMRMFVLLSSVVSVVASAGCGGSESIVGSWRTSDGQYQLQFTDTGGYLQWDAQYPAASLYAVDPSANPRGVKQYGTYVARETELSITAHDGLYPKSLTSADATFSSTFVITADDLDAPGLVTGVTRYTRATSAP